MSTDSPKNGSFIILIIEFASLEATARPSVKSSYQHTVDRIRQTWTAFLTKRAARLEQQARYGHAAEKVAENIIEDLFTDVLDWTIADLNNQVGYADLLLTTPCNPLPLVGAARRHAKERRAVHRLFGESGDAGCTAALQEAAHLAAIRTR